MKPNEQAGISEHTVFLPKDNYDTTMREKRRKLLRLFGLFPLFVLLCLLLSREKTLSNDNDKKKATLARAKKKPMFLSLVLLPPEDDASIQNQINRLSKSHNGPSFPAHITIVGGIPCQDEDEAYRIANILEQGLTGFGPIPCHFSSKPKRFEKTWNQALIVTLDDISEPFVDLCETSRHLLNLTPQCMYPPPVNLPHTSLFYGIENIPDLTEVDPIAPFIANEVALWITTPSTLRGVENWREIDVVQL